MSEVLHVDKVCNTDVSKFLALGWAQLIMNGNGGRDCPFGWDNPAFYIKEDGLVVAALTYSYAEHNHSLLIRLGYVDASRRRKGLYRSLYEALLVKAKDLGAYEVRGITDSNNKEMQAVAIALGRVPENISFIQRLEDAL